MKSKWQIEKLTLLFIFFVYSLRDLVLRCSEIPELAKVHTRLPMQFNFVDFVITLACSKTNFLYRLFTYICALADLN